MIKQIKQKIVNFMKVSILLLTMFSISYGAKDGLTKDDFDIYDPTETNVNIHKEIGKSENLIYSQLDNFGIVARNSFYLNTTATVLKDLSQSYMMATKSLKLYPVGAGIMDPSLLPKNIDAVATEIGNNKSRVIKYNGNSFTSMNSIWNISRGISDVGLIRMLYISHYKDPIFLKYDNINSLYSGVLEQFALGSMLTPIVRSWKGTTPKSKNVWSAYNPSNNMIARPDTYVIDLNRLQSAGLYPYELTSNTLNQVRSGDIIIVDLLDDGVIDFSGVAYKDFEGDYRTPANKLLYPAQNLESKRGYITSGSIPTTTQQEVTITNRTSSGEFISNKQPINNRVIVIPAISIQKTMMYFPKSQNYLIKSEENAFERILYNINRDYLDPLTSFKMFENERIRNLNAVRTAINNSGTSVPNIKPSYSITSNNKILVNENGLKNAILSATTNGSTPNLNYKDDGGVNSMLNGITNIFLKGFYLLPLILMVLVVAAYLLDLMFMAVKEIKMVEHGIQSFMVKAFDKTLKLAMVLIMLALYPKFLKEFFYPLVISKLPVYLLSLDGTNSWLNITSVVDGHTLLDFPKIWFALQSTILGTLAALIQGRIWGVVSDFFKIYSFLYFNPVWAVRYILTKILIMGPFVAVAVISSIFISINVVANIFMSAIFMIIVTIIASVYFVFGVTELYSDKFMLILKIMMITMFQYIIQIMLLVVTISTFKTIDRYLYSGGLGSTADLIPLITTFTIIIVIMKVPTKISRTLEQNI